MTARIELGVNESRIALMALQMFSDAQDFLVHDIMQKAGGFDLFQRMWQTREHVKTIQDKIYTACETNGLKNIRLISLVWIVA